MEWSNQIALGRIQFCAIFEFYRVAKNWVKYQLIDIINNKARHNQIDAKYRQMAFQSFPTNRYLESLVKLMQI